MDAEQVLSIIKYPCEVIGDMLCLTLYTAGTTQVVEFVTEIGKEK